MSEKLSKEIKAISLLESDELRKYYQMKPIIDFMKAKQDHPDYTKVQLCALVGISESTLSRKMKDLDIKSFYRHNIPVNVSRKSGSKVGDHEKVPREKPRKNKKEVDAVKAGGLRGKEVTDEYVKGVLDKALK